MKDEIKELQEKFIASADALRVKMGAYAVHIEIEVDCDRENHCFVDIKC